MQSLSETPSEIVAEEDWRAREEQHRETLSRWVEPHLERKSRGEKHPIMDFLFEYFTFKPGRLMRWTPPAGVALQGDAGRFLAMQEFSPSADGVWLNPEDFPARRRGSIEWVCGLLERIAERPPRLGCFGLHEWAMVYRADQQGVRHEHAPLRLSPKAIEEVVNGHQIVCTHFDAYRFFTPAARPLNTCSPRADTRHEFEQKGCIHVNMDYYKWSYKFFPWLGGDVIREAFELAVFAREIDMRASPYDLSGLGVEPILIETDEGKSTYQKLQQEVARRGDPVREKLLGLCRRLVV